MCVLRMRGGEGMNRDVVVGLYSMEKFKDGCVLSFCSCVCFFFSYIYISLICCNKELHSQLLLVLCSLRIFNLVFIIISAY